jgi:hypothetical protein
LQSGALHSTGNESALPPHVITGLVPVIPI